MATKLTLDELYAKFAPDSYRNSSFRNSRNVEMGVTSSQRRAAYGFLQQEFTKLIQAGGKFSAPQTMAFLARQTGNTNFLEGIKKGSAVGKSSIIDKTAI